MLRWPDPNSSGELLLEQLVKDEVVFINPPGQAEASLQRFPIGKTSLQTLLKSPQSLLARDYRSRDVLAALSLVSGCDWFLVAKVDQEEILMQRRIRAMRALLLVLLGFVFAAMAQRIYYAQRENWHLRQMQNAQDCLTDSVSHMQELERIVEASPVVALLFSADPGKPLRYVSSNIRQFGYTADDFYSDRMTYRQLLHPEDLAANEAIIQKNVSDTAAAFEHTCRIRLRDGSIRRIRQHFSTRRTPGGGSLLQVLIILT